MEVKLQSEDGFNLEAFQCEKCGQMWEEPEDAMSCCHVYYSYEQFVKDVKLLVRKINLLNKKFKGIYCIPRGGYILGVFLSHQLNIPLVDKPGKEILIVDEISDTGKTMSKYKNYTTVCIHYKPNNLSKPTIYLHEKTDKWIDYFWEVGE